MSIFSVKPSLHHFDLFLLSYKVRLDLTQPIPSKYYIKTFVYKTAMKIVASLGRFRVKFMLFLVMLSLFEKQY